jgi:hypothetical protein
MSVYETSSESSGKWAIQSQSFVFLRMDHEQIDQANAYERRGKKPRSDALHEFWHATGFEHRPRQAQPGCQESAEGSGNCLRPSTPT